MVAAPTGSSGAEGSLSIGAELVRRGEDRVDTGGRLVIESMEDLARTADSLLSELERAVVGKRGVLSSSLWRSSQTVTC